MNIRGEPDLQAYRIHVQPNVGIPRAVNVNVNDVPINHDQPEDSLLEGIAGHIRATIGNRLFNTLGVNFERSLQHVTGMLQMFNEAGGGRRVIRQNTYLRNVTGALLEEMLETANRPTSGNGGLGIFNVLFNYLINPDSIRIGGATDTPSKFKGCHPKTLSTVKAIYHGLEIRPNCAAFALKFLKFYEDNPDTTRRQTVMRRKSFLSDLAIDAYIDQGLLNWDTEISIERIRDYLRLIPDHRIVVLVPSIDDHSNFTYDGPDYVYRGKEKIFYLVFDSTNKHFCAVKSPLEMFRGTTGKNTHSYLWCHGCSLLHLPSRACNCENSTRVRIEKRKKPCEGCGADMYKDAKHQCDYTSCRFCSSVYKDGDDSHRCPTWSNKDDRNYPPFVGEEGADPKKAYALWVYDLESMFRYKEGCYTKEFLTDDNGKFIHGINGAEFLEVTVSEHTPNFVCWKNVFTGEKKVSWNVSDFVDDMIGSNGGRNICLAHNGSGYDTRLIFDEIVKNFARYPSLVLNPITRGSKILQLSVELGKERVLRFQDTMLHLPGSLSSLASAILKGRTDIVAKKGWFPYLFNREEYYDYNGSIPDRKFFDLAFTIRSEDDLIRFNEYYESWLGRTDWYVPIEC